MGCEKEKGEEVGKKKVYPKLVLVKMNTHTQHRQIAKTFKSNTGLGAKKGRPIWCAAAIKDRADKKNGKALHLTSQEFFFFYQTKRGTDEVDWHSDAWTDID